MVLRYQSGEEIKKDDHVLFHGEPGKIDLVVDPDLDPASTTPDVSWYVTEFGGGVGVAEKMAGNTFIAASQLADCEDLKFVRRTEE